MTRTERGMVGGLNGTMCRTKPSTMKKDRHQVPETHCDDYGTRQYVPGNAETKHHEIHKRGSSHPLGRTWGRLHEGQDTRKQDGEKGSISSSHLVAVIPQASSSSLNESNYLIGVFFKIYFY